MKAKLLGKALALGLILAQASGLVHVALAPHQICPEHGELVDPSPATASASAGVDADPSAALRANDEGARWADPAHAHCVVAAQQREQAVASRGAQASLPAPLLGAPAAQPAAAPPSRMAGWRVAPKQGPPAA